MTTIELDYSAGSMEKKLRIETDDELTVEVVQEILMDDQIRKFRDAVEAADDVSHIQESVWDKIFKHLRF